MHLDSQNYAHNHTLCNNTEYTVHIKSPYQQQRLQVAEVDLLTGQDGRQNPLAHLQAFLQVQVRLNREMKHCFRNFSTEVVASKSPKFINQFK